MIKSALQSSLTNDVKHRSMSAGAVPSSEYLIQTAVVGSTPVASVAFDTTGLGSQFRHLQLIWLFRESRNNLWGQAFITLNGDAAGNYRDHYLRGDGSTVFSASYVRSGIPIEGAGSSAATGVFAGGALEFLDAFNTNKNTVSRCLQGRALSGDTFVQLDSCLWNNTSSLTSITITPGAGANFVEGSRFSLYGVTA